MLMCASNGKEKFENFYPNTYICVMYVMYNLGKYENLWRQRR